MDKAMQELMAGKSLDFMEGFKAGMLYAQGLYKDSIKEVFAALPQETA